MKYAVGIGCALATWLGAASVAWAQEQAPPGDAGEALATELFNAGRDLLAEGRAAEACAKLAESAKLKAAVGTLARLGECEERVGKLASARAHWQQALNVARSSGDERAAIVEKELARVDAKVPRIRIALPTNRPAGLVVEIDALEVGASAADAAVPVDPGAHTIRARAPGKAPWSLTTDLAADGAVTIVAVPSLEEPRPAAPPAPARDVRSGGLSPLGVAGLVGAGVGAGLIGAGAYFTGVATAKVDESAHGCDGNLCNPAAAAVRNDARAAGNVATALIIGGGALVVSGVTVFIIAPSPRETAKANATIAGPRPACAIVAGPGAVHLRGAF